eukprot:4741698-Prorocentrum_lima.AAC.1
MARYLKAFPCKEECLRSGKVVCPLMPTTGLDAAQNAFQGLVEGSDCVKSQLPSYLSFSAQVQLYGSLKDA